MNVIWGFAELSNMMLLFGDRVEKSGDEVSFRVAAGWNKLHTMWTWKYWNMVKKYQPKAFRQLIFLIIKVAKKKAFQKDEKMSFSLFVSVQQIRENTVKNI